MFEEVSYENSVGNGVKLCSLQVLFVVLLLHAAKTLEEDTQQPGNGPLVARLGIHKASVKTARLIVAVASFLACSLSKILRRYELILSYGYDDTRRRVAWFRFVWYCSYNMLFTHSSKAGGTYVSIVQDASLD